MDIDSKIYGTFNHNHIEAFSRAIPSICARHDLYGASDARHLKFACRVEMRRKAGAEREKLEQGRNGFHCHRRSKADCLKRLSLQRSFRFVGPVLPGRSVGPTSD